jgi:superfamily II DNA or RNA helicase
MVEFVSMSDVVGSISDHIRISTSGLREDVVDALKNYLTIPNEAKHKALQRGDFGARDMEDAFVLWEERSRPNGAIDLLMPRGFADVLYNGLEVHGVHLHWKDMTNVAPLSLVDRMSMSPITLRPEQEDAVQAIISRRQGIVQAAPGVGKTVIALETHRRVGQRTLVLVEKGHLVRQWRERAREHLGVEAGVIGDGVWDEQNLTIATLQTLYRRLPELARSGWFQTWGATFGDEIHHAVARTYRDVLGRVCSWLFAGLTATPLEGDWLQKLLVAVVGPIIHRVDDRVTISPRIVAVDTGFRWNKTKQQERLSDPRAIYRHLIKALESDHGRAEVIVRSIASQPDSCAQLVLSKRVEYLDLIRSGLVTDAGWSDDRIMMYRGKEKLAEREEVARRAEEGSCVILSTLADEGLDIPRLDRLHLTWPARKELTITQQVGRVARPHEAKLSPVVYDYVDPSEAMLYEQFKARRRLYNKKGWEVSVEAVDKNRLPGALASREQEANDAA